MLFTLIFVLTGAGILIAGITSTIKSKRKGASTSSSVGGIIMGSIFIVAGVISGFLTEESEGVAGDEPSVHCTATLLSVKDTRVVVNQDHIYKIRARITPAGGGAPLEVEIRKKLTAWEVGQAAGHREFACVQAASDPKRVNIKLSSPR